jgi:5'-phosphate synthase pdxT subunit
VTVGVLALHGDFLEHEAVLSRLGVRFRDVRTTADLESVDALIIPGGESTVIANLLVRTGLDRAIVQRVKKGALPLFGTCAGAIILAKSVKGFHAPRTLKLLDIAIDRNAYGTQLQSFASPIKVRGMTKPMKVSFIRAPRITSVGRSVEVLSTYRGAPVLVRSGTIFAATFHPEVHNESELHALFLRSLSSQRNARRRKK